MDRNKRETYGIRTAVRREFAEKVSANRAQSPAIMAGIYAAGIHVCRNSVNSTRKDDAR